MGYEMTAGKPIRFDLFAYLKAALTAFVHQRRDHNSCFMRVKKVDCAQVCSFS